MADGAAAADAEPAACARRARALDAVYGAGAGGRVARARVLVVGAGGVGCELVKGLGVAGFREATLVDMDTVDVSNLNRQFLFRRKHVGLAKADVAAAAAMAMVPGMRVTGAVGNVKEARFGGEFLKGFSVVLNALDNQDARRHVNRMCLATGVPMVESGSTAYNGQATVIGKGYECYDCIPQPAAKTFAVCTIRSTPDKPVHCIVWAKHLWDLLFGPDDESNVLRDLDGCAPVAPAANGGAAAGGNGAAPASSSHEKTPLRMQPAEEPAAFALRVAARVFCSDVQEQVDMKGLWTKEGRTPPTPYAVPLGTAPRDLASVQLLESRAWSADESAAVLIAVLARVVTERADEVGSISFDKDDRDALAFVVAAANLRAHSYGVELQSPFAVKGIAGNIVHAIATTNAIVSGLIVLEAIKVVVSGGLPPPGTPTVPGLEPLYTYVRKIPSGRVGRKRLLMHTDKLREANPRCYVCSKGLIPLSMDVDAWTLGTFLSSICKGRLGTLEPTVSVTSGDFANTLYECGEGLEDDEVEMYTANLTRTLRDLRVTTSANLVVDDIRQALSCSLVVTHTAALLEHLPPADRYVLDGALPVAQAHAPPPPADAPAPPHAHHHHADDDEVVVIDADGTESSVTGRKRARDDGPAEPAAKKTRYDLDADGVQVIE